MATHYTVSKEHALDLIKCSGEVKQGLGGQRKISATHYLWWREKCITNVPVDFQLFQIEEVLAVADKVLLWEFTDGSRDLDIGVGNSEYEVKLGKVGE